MEAEELRFGSPPRTDVRFPGSYGRESVSGSDRENLPDPVETGVGYHDVRVLWRMATRLPRRGRRDP